MPDDTTTKLPLRSRRDRKAAGRGEQKTRCECGRAMALRTGTHGARAGCDRCNALDARKFWAARGLPEPTHSSDYLPPA